MADLLTLARAASARFWARTSYKLGRPLDMSDQSDRVMARLWFDAYQRVRADVASGQLVLPPSSDTAIAEANDRFWRQTHLAADEHLDPSNITDWQFAKGWLDIYDRVKSEQARSR